MDLILYITEKQSENENHLDPSSYPRCMFMSELSILIFTDNEMKSYEVTVTHHLIFITARPTLHSIINLSQERSINM